MKEKEDKPGLYRFVRTHKYWYEVQAKNKDEAYKKVQSVWAGDYKKIQLSDFVFDKEVE
jgi:hypothetical protein